MSKYGDIGKRNSGYAEGEMLEIDYQRVNQLERLFKLLKLWLSYEEKYIISW